MAEISALRVPLVVERIFRYLRNKDLVRCRLVGPKNVWNKEACKILHKTYLVVFKQTTDIREFNDIFESLIPGISILPSKFIIYMDKMQKSSENQEMLEQEMKRFGQIAREQVKELTIHEIFHETRFVLLQATIFNFFPNLVKCGIHIQFKETIPVEQQEAVLLLLSQKRKFPVIKPLTNLKEIKFFIFSAFYVSPLFKGWQEFISFTATLLASAPQLQSFHLKAESTTFTQSRCDQQSLRSLMQAVTSNLNSIQLKNITFRHVGFSGEYLRSLFNHPIQFYLKKCFLDHVDTNSVCLTDLEKFFTRHCATLEFLYLVFNGTSKMLCFPFGISMSKLSFLTLDNFEGTIDWKQLPKLKKVSLSSCCLSEIVPTIAKSPSNCSPESFEIVRKRDAEDDKFLAMFIQVTPYLSSGLTKLAIKHGYTVPFAVIFGECRLLKYLRLFYCKGISDEALCGGIKETLQNVKWPEEHSSEENANLDKYYQDKVEQAKKTNLELNRPLPYIGDLKDLEYFSAIIDKREDKHAGESTGILTAASFLYGIIDCKKLKRISLTSSHISTKRATRIIQHAGLDRLTHAAVNNINLLFSF